MGKKFDVIIHIDVASFKLSGKMVLDGRPILFTIDGRPILPTIAGRPILPTIDGRPISLDLIND